MRNKIKFSLLIAFTVLHMFFVGALVSRSVFAAAECENSPSHQDCSSVVCKASCTGTCTCSGQTTSYQCSCTCSDGSSSSQNCDPQIWP